ncbi:MAG: alpha/beta fold hydrolase [Ardenticatenaceae bacterium]|nr:alpha/beta fold hydrolase [Ardenticatenaceae bacterium]
MNASEVEQKYHQAVADKKYTKALALATQYFDLFPPHAQRVVYFWRMEMACLIKDKVQALAVLREAVAAGHWFAQLDENPTFLILKESPEFQSLVGICTQRRLEEIANAPFVAQVLHLEDSPAPYPFVMALHGNSENIEIFAPHWHDALQHGWLVSLPQSPQTHGPDAYVWNDWDWVIPVLQDYNLRIRDEYTIDANKAVLAGFSMGAGLAIRLALENKLAVKGVLAVAPFLSSPEELRPLLAQASNRTLRFYLVASKEDEYCYAVANELSKLFTEYEIVHQLDIYEDVGHSFPYSFEQKVAEALRFIVNA